jgi:hypothetical protein
LLAELSANNSTLQALQQQQQQQQQPGGSPVAAGPANMLTSSRTIGLGARVAATRAPDGSHIPLENRGSAVRKRGSAAAAATTTALSDGSSSGSDDDGGSTSSDHDQVDEPDGMHPTVFPASNSAQDDKQQVQAASATPLQPVQNLQRHSLGPRRRSGSSSSSGGSSSEDEDTAVLTAGDNQLIRGPTVAHPIPRSNEAREARLKLPIVAEEQPLMDLVHHRTCVVLQVTPALALALLSPQYGVTDVSCDAG